MPPILPTIPINAPIGHGPLDVKVHFNESPPVYYKTKFERDIVFSKNSGVFESLTVEGEQHQVLPEQGQCYGIALRPRNEHFHNFIYSYDTNVLFEDNYKVAHGLIEDNKKDLIDFFSWKVSTGWYKETVGNPPSPPLTPLIHGKDYTEASSGSSTSLSDYQQAQQKGAKWIYKLIPVSIHSFAQTGSGLKISDDKVAKLVPFQSQLQSNTNGPTGIGVHWALEKKINIPYGLGFYLDFYINKDIDPLTNDANVIESGDYKDVPFFHNYFQEAFTNPSATGIDNKDVFVGGKNSKNSSFYFINKSYIVIRISGHLANGNCFFLVITSDAHAKLFQVTVSSDANGGTMTTGKVELLSEYNPSSGDTTTISSGLKMLRGNNGHLRLQIRQIMNHILIENNVFETPWIITLPVFTPTPVTGRGGTLSTPQRTEGVVKVNQIGGLLKIFGGNISTGVSFCHLNYYDESEVTLDKTSVWGSARSFYTVMNSFGASEMPNILLTGLNYYPNSAMVIEHSTGWFDDLSDRPDQYFGGFEGKILDKSRLYITDTLSTEGSSTVLETSIKLIAGTAAWYDPPHFFNFGKCITPVLQFCRQISPLVQRYITTTTTTDIEDIIETIEITKEAEDYHSVSTSGSMLVNVLYPGVNQLARDAVIESIGKARYLSIDVSHFGCAKTHLQAYRTSGPPGGRVYTGIGGDRTIFTGIAFNPSITDEAGRRYIKYELNDFWVILDSKIIMNSPYFDGAIDTDVINFFLDHTGFKDKSGVHLGSRDAFPISFNFNTPLAKFQDRKSVAEAIKETARKYSKYAFFNNNGKFCYQRMPTDVLAYAPGPYDVKFYFYSSHIGINRNTIPIGPYYANSIPSGALNHNSQIAYEVKTTQWNNKDIFNKIMLLSVDGRDRGYIIASDANFASFTDPNSLGFLGYERPFIQDEAAFGSFDRVNKILRYYSRMFKPIYNVTWKCIGGNLGVEVFDIVSVDDVLVYITRISHSIDAKNNSWETEYTGEWIYPPLASTERVINVME